MMGYGYWNMMGGFGALGLITWLIVLFDLMLLGIWLWKKINQ